MGAVYQSVAADVKNELDRIRQQADGISPNARAALDAQINSVIADIISQNPRIQSDIANALQTDVIDPWNAVQKR
jgi:hypothetical protein